MGPSRPRCAVGAVLVAALAASVGACGDAADEAGGGAPADSFCADYLALAQALSAAPWNGEPSTYPSRGVMAEYYDDAVDPSAQRVADDDAPEAVRADVATNLEFIRRFGESGADPSTFADPAYFQSGMAIDVHVFENCAFPTNEVVGVDYGFTDLPLTLDAGPHAFEFTNQATSGEWHELVLRRVNEDVTESVDELLMLGQDELSARTTLIAKNLALPDDVIYLFADLEPGTYVALCTIPQGTIGHDLGDGPPHFTLGMAQELTVG